MEQQTRPKMPRIAPGTILRRLYHNSDVTIVTVVIIIYG